MKITDETKTFHDGGVALEVSSNVSGNHDMPSAYLYLDGGEDGSVGFGTFDPDQIKEIIEHMAKMAGLVVTIAEAPEPGGFTPKFQKDDRVRSLSNSRVGTVISDEPQEDGWNVRVMLDGVTFPGLYAYDELEPLSGE